MKTLNLKFYEYAALEKDAALLICRTDDPRLPHEIKCSVQVPCIITGDCASLKEKLTLRHIAELWEAAAPFHKRRANTTAAEAGRQH
ncbi:MAG: hypothetical protein H0T45_02295 [Pyrinomonadaceae bacterium]|nr:hypothetical protein [Pyrinomonadaceae bacterium]